MMLANLATEPEAKRILTEDELRTVLSMLDDA